MKRRILFLFVAALLALSCEPPFPGAGKGQTGPALQEDAIGPVQAAVSVQEVQQLISSQVWKSSGPDTPLLDSFLRPSPNIRWYWAGCTTMIGVNTSTKEILLLDGYVSKSALGLWDFDMFELGRAKIEQYCANLASLCMSGYRITGLLVTHGHADHMGDIPVILHRLKKYWPALPAFPVITDYQTYMASCRLKNPQYSYPNEYTQIKSFKELVTDLIVYYPSTGSAVPAATVELALRPPESLPRDPAVVAAWAQAATQVSSYAKTFTGKYQVYNIAGKKYTGANGLALGSFRATAYLMDHAYLPLGNDDQLRVNAFKVWGAAAPDNVEVLFLDTTNELNFITENIATDHLFLSWAPTTGSDLPDSGAFGLGHNREYTARAVKERIRFNREGLHFIIPLHVDDIAWSLFNRDIVCSSALKFGSLENVNGRTTALMEPHLPYGMPTVFLTDAEFQRRTFLPTTLKLPVLIKRTDYPNAPSVDVLGHTSSGQSATTSPLFYYYKPQGTSHLIMFAIIDRRLGIEF